VINARREIDELIERRGHQLREVDREMERWRHVDACIVAVDQAAIALRNHPAASPELRAELTSSALRDLRKRIGELLEAYGRLAARFARQSVAIGVSGQARVGKSTLLQALSGLGDGQIPTGSGWPVTAVRIRLDHSNGRPRAVVQLHSSGSFLKEVVEPLHRELGLSTSPASLDEFEAWRYPDEGTVRDEHRPSLVRLAGLQSALWSYRAELDEGGEREIPLGELRSYVAYPPRGEARPARKYAAVKEARIECQFPHEDLGKLSVVDLPGLGEAPDAELRHLEGLRDEVDAVLLIKRAVEGMAYWGQADQAALGLLSKAAGPIRRVGDFVYLVVNQAAGDSDELVAGMEDHMRQQLNGGEDGRFFSAWRVNAASQEDVGARVLAPLLDTLAERLPVMDRDMAVAATAWGEDLAQTIRTEIIEFERTLHRLRGHFTAQAEDLKDRTRVMREDITVDLGSLLEDLEVETQKLEDTDFLAAIEAAYERLLGWIALGLGTGQVRRAERATEDGGPPGGNAEEEAEEDKARQAWCAQALRKMKVDKGDGKFATDEFNRLRVEISRGFADIDVHFAERIRRLRREVALILIKHTGRLLDPLTAGGDIDGDLAMTAFADLLIEGYEPSPTLRAAVTELLDVRLEYRTQLYPHVRAQLSQMRLNPVNRATGKPETQITVPTNEQGAEELYDFLRMRTEQAAFRTFQELSKQSVLPSLVLYAVLEQFEDTLIRSGESESEFERFARSYQNELWPDRDEGLVGTHARVATLTRACREVRRALDGAEPGQDDREREAWS
jgi:hypothetical protein